MIKFESLNGDSVSWPADVILGVKKINVLDSDKEAYFVINSQDNEIEISKSCYNEFIEAGFKVF